MSTINKYDIPYIGKVVIFKQKNAMEYFVNIKNLSMETLKGDSAEEVESKFLNWAENYLNQEKERLNKEVKEINKGLEIIVEKYHTHLNREENK
ncbi:hypothetical protein KAJ87_03125 [Candidatus Pacearchaeota archaeon]|nr:hypothetical protein [Candidatus Pacearchaeota archaeon]